MLKTHPAGEGVAGGSKKSAKNQPNWTAESPKAKHAQVPSPVEGPCGAGIKQVDWPSLF